MDVLLGNGAGGFRQVASFAGGAETGAVAFASLAVGDLNGDGKPDLAVGNYTTGTVSIFLGAGDGTFTAGPVLPGGTHPDAIAVGDLNHDGLADIAAADGSSDDVGTSAVTVLLGKADGTFAAAAPFTADPITTGVKDLNSIAIGDIDNDGTPDLVVGGGGDVAVLRGSGDGTFRLGSVNKGVAGTEFGTDGEGLALADVNGDGRTDILTPGENLAPDLNQDAGLSVSMNEPTTVVGSTSPSVSIDRPAVAVPALSETTRSTSARWRSARRPRPRSRSPTRRPRRRTASTARSRRRPAAASRSRAPACRSPWPRAAATPA